jgi:hypothetical protein
LLLAEDVDGKTVCYAATKSGRSETLQHYSVGLRKDN